MNTALIGVLLVDPSAGFVSRALAHLHTVADVQVLGCAFSGCEALELAAQLRPQVVVLAQELPAMSGLDLAGMLRTHAEGPGTVLVVVGDTPGYMLPAMLAGVDAIVEKSGFVTGLTPAIRTAAKRRQRRNWTQTRQWRLAA